MSRVEHLTESGFAPREEFETERCPDCRDNELSPPSSPDPQDAQGRAMGSSRTFACETCGGFGTVPVVGKHNDPYMTPIAQYG